MCASPRFYVKPKSVPLDIESKLEPDALISPRDNWYRVGLLLASFGAAIYFQPWLFISFLPNLASLSLTLLLGFLTPAVLFSLILENRKRRAINQRRKSLERSALRYAHRCREEASKQYRLLEKEMGSGQALLFNMQRVYQEMYQACRARQHLTTHRLYKEFFKLHGAFVKIKGSYRKQAKNYRQFVKPPEFYCPEPPKFPKKEHNELCQQFRALIDLQNTDPGLANVIVTIMEHNPKMNPESLGKAP